MSQAHSNPGYYNTYNGGMIYSDPMDNNNPQYGQAAYTPTWSQMPISAAIPLNGSQWSGQYYRRSEGWYDTELLSTSDMTSERSGFDYSATPSLHRSDSGDFSEVWDPEPPIPFSSFQPHTSSGLLNNIGSAFTPLQLPACATSIPNDTMPHSELILGDLELNDRIASPRDSDAISHTVMHCSPFSDAESLVVQQRYTQPHDLAISAKPRKVRQAKETETSGQSRRPARTNSTRVRLFCEACRDSKDYSRGFRGEHELARHYAQKHTRHKKVWKCFDLSPDRLMRNCERCKSGHQYGTSYGGAEHFRRKHTGIFGKDMMELLRGKNQRWALSSNRLIEEGWLRQVFVPGDGEPIPHQEETAAPTEHTPMPFAEDAKGDIPNSGIQRAHVPQPYDQQHVSMHDANLAWPQHPYMLQPYHQLHQGQLQQHQQKWHAGIH